MMEFSKHVFTCQTIDMVQTGMNLKRIREVKKITVNDVAKYLSISVQSVYNWEAGKTDFNIRHLVSLCDLYSVKLDDIVEYMPETAEYCDYDE